MKDNILEVHNLSKAYKTKTQTNIALDNLSLTVPRGSFFALLGPNGAGKSTFINILAGLTSKTSGTISIAGYDYDNYTREAKHKIGVVPQEPLLDVFFTVQETLELHAGYYGVKKINRKTSEIISALGLKDKADAAPRALSGGMKRRLLIGKALVHSPELLVLDEPTAGVDIELRLQLWEYIKKLNKAGTSIILTTHYLEEAEALCDHIAIINHGKLIASDSKDNLLHLLDFKEMHINISNPINFVPENLKQFNCELINENKILVKYKASEIKAYQIIDAFKHADLEITDLSTKEADLQDVFRFLTKM